MPAIFASGAVRNDDGTITPVVDAPIPGDMPSADAAGQPAMSEPTIPTETLLEPAPAVEPEPEESEDDAVDSTFAQPDQRPNRPFVARLLRENQSFKDRLADLEAQNRILVQRLQAPAPVSSPEPVAPSLPSAPAPVALRREDYADEASYVAAMVQVHVDQALRQRDTHATIATMGQKWDAQVQAGQTKYPDFDAALTNPQAMVVPAMQPVLFETVSESTVGSDLLYYLGTHPQEVRTLNGLTPTAAARYLGRLEAQLASQVTAPTPPARSQPPARPAVPRPLAPTQGGGAPAPVTGFRPGMPLADYEAMRTAQRGGRR